MPSSHLTLAFNRGIGRAVAPKNHSNPFKKRQ